MDELQQTTHLPTDSVRVVLFRADGAFLMVQESDDPAFKLPGGKFESGETVPQAVTRELDEELGSKIAQVAVTYAGKLITDDGVSSRYIFSASISPADIVPGSDIAQIQWVMPAEIPQGKNQRHMQSAVNLALAQTR